MATQPDEIQAGLRILARMIAEAYLADVTHRNGDLPSSADVAHDTANPIADSKTRAVTGKRRRCPRSVLHR